MRDHLQAQPALLHSILKFLYEVILFEENSNHKTNINCAPPP